MASRILPLELKAQIERFGIDVKHPTHLYAYEVMDGGAKCRILFHVVGKVLSGPVVFREHPKLGRVLHYKELGPPPRGVSLAVLPSRETTDSAPLLGDDSAGDLLQIDLRLFVPLRAARASVQAIAQ
jgi:hypothetical protein